MPITSTKTAEPPAGRTAPPPVAPANESDPQSPPAGPPEVAEGSIINRVVAVLTPILAIVATGLVAKVAQFVPGAHLDPSEVIALMATVATTLLTSAVTWLKGWQQHERLVAEGVAPPVVDKRTRAAKRARN